MIKAEDSERSLNFLWQYIVVMDNIKGVADESVQQFPSRAQQPRYTVGQGYTRIKVDAKCMSLGAKVNNNKRRLHIVFKELGESYNRVFMFLCAPFGELMRLH